MQESKPIKDQLHLAAQYLAAANISFLEKKADDSHTNLGFDVDTMSLKTHDLSASGDILSLNYRKFSLEWSSKGKSASIALNGKSHKEVLSWLQEQSQTQLSREYVYAFHYELPYTIDDEFEFQLTDISRLEELRNLRVLAEYTLERVIEKNKLNTPVRIWPHHFDTGGYTALDETSGIAIGFGMAIPDSLSDTHYFYISGYKNGSAVFPNSANDLTLGKWVDQGFKGAIVSAADLIESESVQFFQEAIDQFKQ